MWERRVMEIDQQIASAISTIAKGKLRLGFFASMGVSKIVVPHDNRRIAIEDDARIFEADSTPGLNGEAMIFGHNLKWTQLIGQSGRGNKL